ncbi:unnamed protein product, partial [Rotaria magnacalcarata]
MYSNLTIQINATFYVQGAPELDGRPVIESIISIIISEAWSSCAIVIKELSHLLIT